MKLISGGARGFGDVVWSVESHKKHRHVTFTYDSFENEQGPYFNYLFVICPCNSCVITTSQALWFDVYDNIIIETYNFKN